MMTIPDGLASPFHSGEQAIQARLGIQTQMAEQGRRVIRDHLLDQHRQFFTQLPYILVGIVDAVGCPWTSILTGPPGFLQSPDDRTLQITAQPLLGDPLNDVLTDGIDIGLLGIELHTRRRNRLNGVVTKMQADWFAVQVRQSFGNCPKYIQARMVEWRDDAAMMPPSVLPIATLGRAEQALITAADTFFITTAYQGETAGGVDVSHRGGKPGFVRIDADRTLTIPDFVGNFYFNTLGNLEVNPYAGLLFIDFARGDRLYLTGTAEVIWTRADVSAYAGAERLLRFTLDRGYRIAGGLPLRGSEPEFSPYLDRMGTW
jgi:uncharacterized protein